MSAPVTFEPSQEPLSKTSTNSSSPYPEGTTAELELAAMEFLGLGDENLTPVAAEEREKIKSIQEKGKSDGEC
jgi:hypothetical protein